jgi:4-hydroxybenzoate polyprenyltransferase
MTSNDIPLCVDLDGTLVASDTLHESLLELVRRQPLALLQVPGWILKGKAKFKQEVASRISLDVTSLPYRQDLLEWLKAERDSGRRLVLATASDEKTARQIADHLQIFDEVIASNGTDNLSSESKRRALVEGYGEKGFDYIGNEACDEAVWKSSRHALVVGNRRMTERAARVTTVEKTFAVPTVTLNTWLKAMRLHQWVKNGLVFLPAILAHKILQPVVLLDSLQAFLAFGLCASSVYLINDLLDLPSDRHHPRKRLRPFATGALSASSGVFMAITLLVGSALLAAMTTPKFCLILAGYYALTWVYSLRLKREVLLDVMTLAGLYTVRVIAGAAATSIFLSFWLLAFSVFVFLSLGFVKRYTELNDAALAGKASAHGRGYSAADLPLILNLGTAAGYCTVVVMALYINSSDSQTLYRHSKPLWLICPLLLYWISHVWLLTTRGQMHDDPLVFALKDRTSLLVFALLGIIVFMSI